MSKIKICFATWELRGFTPGGIGVLVSNILSTYGADQQVSLSILWYGDGSLHAAAFKAVFPNCDFYRVDEYVIEAGTDYAVPEASMDKAPAYANSVRLMRALAAIEARYGAFDFVEFPDFDGAAFATLQEKRLGRAFQNTTICVRLHSTESVLRTVDHRPILRENALRSNVERKALADADLVIAHLKPIAQSIKELFGFPTSWMDKVRIELPPVLTLRSTARTVTRIDDETPVILSGKVQWGKRPAVFINGLVGFMRRVPNFRGKALLLAHVIDGELKRHCEDLIPTDLRDRFSFMGSMSDDRREAIIARSVVVVASAYESFCLAAYEANMLGAITIVNAANPAFGEETPWTDKVNCLKFDGSASALAASLENLWTARDAVSLQMIDRKSFGVDPYWLSHVRAPATRPEPQSPSVSFVVLCGRHLGDPFDTVASLLAMSQRFDEIILVFESLSGPPEHAILVERASQVDRISVVSLDFEGGEAALANLGVKSAKGDIIIMARAGAIFDPDFVRDGVKSLAQNAEYDFVVPQVAYRSGDGATCHNLFVGEACASATWENHFGSLEFVGRTHVVRDLSFDENLDRYVELDFHFRACLSGARYVTANTVGVSVELRPEGIRFFRSHLDAVFAKHRASIGTGSLRLISVVDSATSVVDNFTQQPFPSVRIGKRDLQYYISEPRPWWKIALKRPLNIARWFLLREIQRMKSGA